MPKEEYRPTTLGELKAALAELNLPDDTPLMANEVSGHPNGRYTGFIILAPRQVKEVQHGDHRRFAREDDHQPGTMTQAIYIVG